MRKSLLPEAGENIFQKAKRLRAEAAARGVKIINLSIGQPTGPAPLEARKAAAEAIMSEKESMHEYQDNGCPGFPEFARRFVQAHVHLRLSNHDSSYIDYLPIPGIKPMLGVVAEALGCWSREGDESLVLTMTEPGYPTPADQCKMIRNVRYEHLPLDPEKGFLFNPYELTSILSYEEDGIGEGDAIMLNLPHNPTGVVATREWLHTLCRYCQDRGIRLFNDAAYAILTYTGEAATLTDVAVNFAGLEWAEAFSASKAGNMTGWRVGAMVGSPGFIGDIKRIKGNTDSGLNAALAIGALHFVENCHDELGKIRETYASRLGLVADILTERGMRLAVRPEAGFFLLFDCPNKAFGQEIADAEQFNVLMTDQTGVNGIPFGEKKQWIRYAICACDVKSFESEICAGFDKAEVSY